MNPTLPIADVSTPLPLPRRTRGIVGGMFALPQVAGAPALDAELDFLQDDALHAANARSAILILLEHLNCRRCWIPSYLCPSIVSAINATRLEPLYYPVDGRLQCSETAWLGDLQPGDLVVLIDYFGFPASEDLAAAIKQRGCSILEDASQALLTRMRLPSADFIVFSPRKFLGVPDGGILLSQSDADWGAVELDPPDSWWLCNLEAMIRRREFDHNGTQNDWFQWYLKAKKATPCGRRRMSEMTRTLLKSAFDYQWIAERRVANYEFLLKALPELALFPGLSPGVVPLGFPIRVGTREPILRDMHACQIYPPIHWEIHGTVPERFASSLDLSQQIMTLPCDDRYGAEEMTEMIRIIRKFCRPEAASKVEHISHE